MGRHSAAHLGGRRGMFASECQPAGAMKQPPKRQLRKLNASPVRTRSRRPRILYFSPYWPEQAASAGELRALHIARALRVFGEVEMAVVHDHERAQGPGIEFKVVCSLPVQSRPNAGFGQKLRWVLSPR